MHDEMSTKKSVHNTNNREINLRKCEQPPQLDYHLFGSRWESAVVMSVSIDRSPRFESRSARLYDISFNSEENSSPEI